MVTLQPNQDQEVTINQQGTLILKQSSETPAGTGNTTITETVPVGKKWVIKAINGTLTGTMTITAWSMRINNGTVEVTISDATAAGLNTILSNDLIWESGQSITARATLSAYTSGTVVMKLAYVELNS
jgi:hypothetical protein